MYHGEQMEELLKPNAFEPYPMTLHEISNKLFEMLNVLHSAKNK